MGSMITLGIGEMEVDWGQKLVFQRLFKFISTS